MKNVGRYIYSHEFYCIGGVSIDGVIGARNYPELITYEDARKLYIYETNYLKAKYRLSDEELFNGTAHKLGATYRGSDTFNKLLKSYWRKGISCPAMKYLDWD